MPFRNLLFAFLSALSLLTAGSGAARAEVLRWAAQRDILSLDPHSVGSTGNLAFTNHLYEGLLRFSAEFTLEPALATSWEATGGGLVWRFHLRQGVRFHDGAEFNADDVVASLSRFTAEGAPMRGNLPFFEGVTRVDDFTVDIAVSTPGELFLHDLSVVQMMDAGWLAAHDSLKATSVAAGTNGYATFHANGTGPFRLESRQPDIATILTRNPDWWDKAAHNIDRIEFTPVVNPTTRLIALLSGSVDLIDGVPLKDLSMVTSTPGLRLISMGELRMVMLGFNRRETLADGRPNPFNDSRIREAVSLAIDRDYLVQRVMRGLAKPSDSLVAPEIAGYVPEQNYAPEYDPDRARQLLTEAGALGLEFSILCASDETVNEEAACRAIHSMLRKVGFAPTLDIAPRAIQSPRRAAGEGDIFLMSWANEPSLDSFSILSQVLTSPESEMPVANFGGWSLPQIDELARAAREEPDTGRRHALQAEAISLAQKDRLLLPLYQQPLTWGVSARLSEFAMRPDNRARHWLTRMTPSE